jgi:AraC-like DNA-binding protein
MLWSAQSRRDVELLEKQERMKDGLGDFRRSLTDLPEDLPWKMREILEYVHENLFDSELNVSTVRRDCRLRNNNISSRFRCSVGLGLRDYIEAARIEAASRLLRHRDLEIYLISMAVGYDHQETFCRAFQRRKGCTPSEYRIGSSGGHPGTEKIKRTDQEAISISEPIGSSILYL